MYADFIAGWAAVGHPLDTVKARLQTMNHYKGITDCFMKTIKQESLFGLYKGLWIPFLSTGALHSILFAGYGFALRALHPGESNVEARKDLPINEIMIASICATWAQLGPVIPVELIKTKLQVQRENVGHFTKHSSNLYSGPMDCIRQTVKKDGMRGLFKGGSVIFVRDNIGYLFYIPVYELMLRQFRNCNFNETASQLIAGGSAGVCGWISVCPLEVVKNRIQADKGQLKRSPREVASQIYREEGPRAFYRGGLAISVRGFIVNAVIFLVYENSFTFIDKL